MSYVKVNVSYKKYKDLKLIEKIRFENSDNFYCFSATDMFICKHVEVLKNVYDYKKFSNIQKTLNHQDCLKYIDFNNFKFKFKDNYLESESTVRNTFCDSNIEIFEKHLGCEICTKSSIKKEIRRRSKLTVEEMCDISYDLGSNYPDSKIQKQYSLSKTSLFKFKSNRKNKRPLKKNRKQIQSSITSYDKNRILNLIQQQPIEFNNTLKIKNFLHLNCHPATIRNVLNRNNYKLHTLKETPYLNPLNKALKDKFCNLTKDLTGDDWMSVVFTDEKIIQNFNNGKYKGYRLRFNKKAGRGFDRRSVQLPF